MVLPPLNRAGGFQLLLHHLQQLSNCLKGQMRMEITLKKINCAMVVATCTNYLPVQITAGDSSEVGNTQKRITSEWKFSTLRGLYQWHGE